MALSSMTGFARADGVCGAYVWAWELKSVNAKGLEVRLRLPPGWDLLEAPLRGRTLEALSRGTVNGTLIVRREGVPPVVRVNEPVLAAMLATIRDIAGRTAAAPPTLDGILSLKGVIEVIDEDERESDRRAAEAAVIGGYAAALAKPWAASWRRGSMKSRRSRRVPRPVPAAGPTRSRHGLPSRLPNWSRPPIGSTPIGCTRRRS
jgi:uncharacterized protein (TIGR00255 family)